MPIFDGLGRSLRWLRERQVKRQYQVAAGAGITKAMLSAYETGKQKPSLDTLEKILDALVCDLNDLHNALQIVNGRPERMRNAGGDYWRAADKSGGSLPSGPGLYEILGAEEPLPQQEEQAMSEMLGGFHKLLRYMHGRIPGGAPATSPTPSQAQPQATPGAPSTAGSPAAPAPSSSPAAPSAPADPTASPEAKPSPPAHPDPAGRGGS
ncbi:MAG TPA: helix-turn-helix transcriptional regulator [Thermoanaerobaculia bacterium]|nr:helix-turn-helix transcriptional regulator [Thermoanaerobaculia bacterium]